MLAVDTNVVVRFLTRDDARQTARAEELLRSEQILISKTVLLETEWVLRYSYGFDREAIETVVRGVAGLPTVHFEDMATVARALDWFAAGMDFADALHLAGSSSADGFATFDKKLVSTARRVAAVPGVSLV
jgi:predicted nucleic-acid-binding protein